jgi:hypothetical protein
VRRLIAGCIVLLGVGCSELSGVSDFQVGDAGGSDQGGAPNTGSGGSGGNTGGSGGSGGEIIADGPFDSIREVTVLNSANDEDDPSFTADGLELFFNTTRAGNGDIWRSSRASLADNWDAPTSVSELNSSARETNPVIAPDGLKIWFRSNRVQAPGVTYTSTRADRQSTWSAPMIEALQDPTYQPGAASDDLLTMMLYSDVQHPVNKLFEVQRATPDATWKTAIYITELDDGATNQEPWMSPDSRYSYWSRSSKIWRAARPAAGATFVDVEPVSELDFLGAVGDPWLLPDQSYIMLTVGTTNRNIYEARR